MKTFAAVALLSCLLAIKVEGQARAPSIRCLCAHKGVNMVPPKLIEKVDIIPPTPSCGNLEIVVTLKNGAEPKCLSPDSKFTQKHLIKALEKRTLQK
ncbi:C-X-C motif chemokine 11-6 [Danio aesculapii]|uniref:C-X-C motif chemokine 11-6 n=1 Tax=Danio aesculapii TaxID=1142201 RepID=UPI0024BF12BE|nr:C-X-C motif chemokine 11-6 [Danio aesculapii]